MLKNTIKTVHVEAERALKIKRKSFGKCLSFIYELMCSCWVRVRRKFPICIQMSCLPKPRKTMRTVPNVCWFVWQQTAVKIVPLSKHRHMKNAQRASWLMEPKIRKLFPMQFSSVVLWTDSESPETSFSSEKLILNQSNDSNDRPTSRFVEHSINFIDFIKTNVERRRVQ